MSVDLTVPLTRQIQFSELFPMISQQYNALLGIDETVAIECLSLENNRKVPICLDKMLNVKTLYLMRERDFPDVEVELVFLNGAFELTEIFPNAIQRASIAVRAAGGEPRRMVLGAAIAIALALLSGTAIVDAPAWSGNYVSSPPEFIQQLKVRIPGKTLVEASRLFCAQISQSHKAKSTGGEG